MEPTSIFEHADFIAWGAYILFGYFLWSSKRILTTIENSIKDINANVKDLADRVTEIERDHAMLKTEHSFIMKAHHGKVFLDETK